MLTQLWIAHLHVVVQDLSCFQVIVPPSLSDEPIQLLELEPSYLSSEQ